MSEKEDVKTETRSKEKESKKRGPEAESVDVESMKDKGGSPQKKRSEPLPKEPGDRSTDPDASGTDRNEVMEPDEKRGSSGEMNSGSKKSEEEKVSDDRDPQKRDDLSGEAQEKSPKSKEEASSQHKNKDKLRSRKKGDEDKPEKKEVSGEKPGPGDEKKTPAEVEKGSSEDKHKDDLGSRKKVDEDKPEKKEVSGEKPGPEDEKKKSAEVEKRSSEDKHKEDLGSRKKVDEDKPEKKELSGEKPGPGDEKKKSAEVEKGSKEKKEDQQKKEKEKPVKVEFGPIPEDGSEILRDVDLPTRKGVVDELVKKHKDFKGRFLKEMKELEKPPVEIKEESEDQKEKRDRINQEVADLKESRTALKEKNRELREKFFELIHKEETVQKHKKDIKMHRSYVQDLEWKLNTEAIDIETERRLLDEMKATMRKIREITDGLTPEEIRSELSDIEDKIAKNLLTIEDLHSRLLEKVEESNVHHEKFVDAKKKLQQKESRKGWLDRRTKLHEEMAIFWEGQRDQAVKMDGEESSRSLESIRTELLKLFQDRDSKKDDTPPRKKDRRSKPRKKLQIKEDQGGSVEPRKESEQPQEEVSS